MWTVSRLPSSSEFSPHCSSLSVKYELWKRTNWLMDGWMVGKTKSLADGRHADEAILSEALTTHFGFSWCTPGLVVLLRWKWCWRIPAWQQHQLCVCVGTCVRCSGRPTAWLMSVPLIALSLQGFQLRLGPWPRAGQVQLICHQAGQGSLHKLHRPGQASAPHRQSLSCLDQPSISLAALIFAPPPPPAALPVCVESRIDSLRVHFGHPGHMLWSAYLSHRGNLLAARAAVPSGIEKCLLPLLGRDYVWRKE